MPLEIRSSLPSASIEVFAAPSEELQAEIPNAGATVVLETPVLKPTDLTESHGIEITAARLQELADSYDPEIEMAPLNFDHQYGGPSFGWCEEVWVRDGLLWVRYVELAEEAVEGIRKRHYTRRSAEFVLKHPVTGGWYFTGLALLGNQRPAVLGLPPLRLHRPRHVLVAGAEPRKESSMPKPAVPAEPPPPQEPTPPAAESVQLSAAEVERLRAGVGLVDQLRLKNAKLEADAAIKELGARVTPAMRKIALPLLTQLMAQDQPLTIKLEAEGKSSEITVADALIQILSALPGFEALATGTLAGDGDDGAVRDTRSADVVSLHARRGLSPERIAELGRKYQEGA